MPLNACLELRKMSHFFGVIWCRRRGGLTGSGGVSVGRVAGDAFRDGRGGYTRFRARTERGERSRPPGLKGSAAARLTLAWHSVWRWCRAPCAPCSDTWFGVLRGSVPAPTGRTGRRSAVPVPVRATLSPRGGASSRPCGPRCRTGFAALSGRASAGRRDRRFSCRRRLREGRYAVRGNHRPAYKEEPRGRMAPGSPV